MICTWLSNGQLQAQSRLDDVWVPPESGLRGLDELRGPHQEWVIAYKLVSKILDHFPAFPYSTAADEF